MISSGITKFSTLTGHGFRSHLGIRIVMSMTILAAALVVQSCSQQSKTVKEIAPEYEGLVSGITVSNPRDSSQDIELLKEDVLVTVSDREFKFEGTYVLKNKGSKKELEVGLPLFIASSIPRWEDSGRYLETPNLVVKSDGKELKATEKKISKVEEVAYLELDRGKQVKIKPESVATPWMVWNQSFEANKQQTLKITYNQLYDKRVKLGRDDKYLDPIQFYYISDGGPWEGSPKRKISFKLKGIKKEYLAEFRQTPSSQTKDLIAYDLTNKDVQFVGIGYRPGLKNKDVLNAIKAKMKKSKNKDKYIVRLAKEYKLRKMFKEQQDLYSKFVAQNKDKLTKQLMNQRSEKVFESITQNFSDFKDKPKAKQLAKDMVPIIKKQLELNSKSQALTYKSAKKQKEKNYNQWLEICQKVL